MAKLATLIDDFQDNVIDGAKWVTSGTVAETGGRARLTPTTSFSFWGTVLPHSYDLTDSQVIVHIPTITSNGATGTLQSGIVVQQDSNNYVGMRKVGSQLICTKSVAGVETQLSFTPYNAVNHLFWRIRADASNVYWETSSTATFGFVQHTANIATLGFSISVVGFYFFTGYSGVEAFPGTFQIEAVNPGLAFIASASSTSTGSLDWITTAPGEFASDGASTSTGSLIFTLVLPGSVNLSASGLSSSTGTLDFGLLSIGTLALVSAAASSSTGDLTFSIAAEEEVLVDEYYYFEPPIAYDLPPTLPDPTRPRYLNAHARWKGGQRRGRSVLKTSGVYQIIDSPSVDQMAAADEVYQGGHIYTITAAIAQGLIDAGFTVTPANVAYTVYPELTLYPALDQPVGYRELILI